MNSQTGSVNSPAQNNASAQNNADELLARCKRAGVLIAMTSRCIYDVDGSAVPYAETVRYAHRIEPSDTFRRDNGTLVTRSGTPLRPEQYGKVWCFADENPMNVEDPTLSDELWKARG